jgi:hypothetical protein
VILDSSTPSTGTEAASTHAAAADPAPVANERRQEIRVSRPGAWGGG